MKKTFYIIILISLFSCKAYKQKICATCPTSRDTVTITTEKIIPHDTTIYVTQWSEPIYIDSPCKDLCDSLGRLKPFDFIKRDNGIITEIKSQGNAIKVVCRDSALKAHITELEIRLSTITKEKDVSSVYINYLTGFQWFCVYSGYILWIILISIALYFLIRALLKK